MASRPLRTQVCPQCRYVFTLAWPTTLVIVESYTYTITIRCPRPECGYEETL